MRLPGDFPLQHRDIGRNGSFFPAQENCLQKSKGLPDGQFLCRFTPEYCSATPVFEQNRF